MHNSIQAHRVGIVLVVPHQKAKVEGHSNFLNVDDEVKVQSLRAWREAVHDKVHDVDRQLLEIQRLFIVLHYYF